MPSGSSSAGTVDAICSNQPVPTPAPTRTGARSHAFGTSWSSSQSLTRSSASLTSIGDSFSAWPICATAVS